MEWIWTGMLIGAGVWLSLFALGLAIRLAPIVLAIVLGSVIFVAALVRIAYLKVIGVFK